MKKNVYFCGSIRGEKANLDLFKLIIDYINKNNVCLTEHIGDLSLLKDEKKLSDNDIYLRDIEFLKKSDLVIAECTSVSIGVGYELAYAEKLNKKVYCLYNKNKTNLSAMISGDDYFIKVPYESDKDILKKLKNIL